MHEFPKWRAVAALVMVGGACLAASASFATPDAIVTALLSERLPDLKGQELQVVTVEYPRGGASAPHRHDAFVVVYVLEGALRMQVAGQPEVTVKAGQTFIERPPDVHAVSRNASGRRPAKFLAILIKAVGAPPSQAEPVAR